MYLQILNTHIHYTLTFFKKKYIVPHPIPAKYISTYRGLYLKFSILQLFKSGMVNYYFEAFAASFNKFNTEDQLQQMSGWSRQTSEMLYVQPEVNICANILIRCPSDAFLKSNNTCHVRFSEKKLYQTNSSFNWQA